MAPRDEVICKCPMCGLVDKVMYMAKRYKYWCDRCKLVFTEVVDD